MLNPFLQGSGFTFCGVHSSVFGCWYLPPAERFAQMAAPFETYTESVLGKHGGYYFGNRLLPRDFELACYYEELDGGQWERILAW